MVNIQTDTRNTNLWSSWIISWCFSRTFTPSADSRHLLKRSDLIKPGINFNLDKDEGENWGGDSLVGGVFKFGKVGLDSSLKLLDPPQSSRDWRHVLADRRRT